MRRVLHVVVERGAVVLVVDDQRRQLPLADQPLVHEIRRAEQQLRDPENDVADVRDVVAPPELPVCELGAVLGRDAEGDRAQSLREEQE